MKLDNQYEYLNTREGFNKALNHFKNVSTIIREFADNINLADLLNEAVAEKSLDQEQIPPIIHALLVDKYGYLYESFNLPRTSQILQKYGRKWRRGRRLIL
jgi:translation initiation factor 2 alpha subunit (eIF-2alpha)